jgi:cell division protein FtsW
MRKTHQPDYLFIISLAIILFLGLIFLITVSSPLGSLRFNDKLYYFKHQLFFGLIPGLICFFVLSQVDYQWYKKIALFLLIGTLVLLFLVLLPNLGFSRGVSRRWLNIAGFSFQPAELAKLTFLLYLASWLDSRKKQLKSWSKGFFPFLILLVIFLLPIVLQQHLSILVIIFLISITLYFLAGARVLHLIVICGLVLILFFSMIILTPFRLKRLEVFLDPGVEPRAAGYHLQQSLIAIGSGGLIGRGLGQSMQKFLYLPETFGDSIFAIMAEELGFLAITALLLLFGFFIYRGLKIAQSAPDNFGYLVASGISFWFFFQVAINISAMIGLLPLTGVPLPLISYGGSAMVIFLAALGIVVNISRQAI